MFAGLVVEAGMVAIARATAVEAVEADIETRGIVLARTGQRKLAAGKQWHLRTHNGVEALGAVLAVDRLAGSRSVKLCDGQFGAGFWWDEAYRER